MREKSSRELTSLSSRRLLRWAVSRRLRCAGGKRLRAVVERILERSQHQGQRRAELVADVGEERRLGAIELGQRLGPPPLLLVGLRIGDRGGDLAGDQVEEAAIVVVEQPEGIEADHEHAGAAGLAGRRDRQERRLRRRLGPRSRGNRRVCVCEAARRQSVGVCVRSTCAERPR